jgi:hypothetical protein
VKRFQNPTIGINAADGERNASELNPETLRPAGAPDFAVQPSYVRTVFLGAGGLRAGWGFAFYVAMFYPLQFVVSRWLGLWSWARAGFGR